MSDAVPVWLTVGRTTCRVGYLRAKPHPDDWQPKLAELLHALADEFDVVPELIRDRARP